MLATEMSYVISIPHYELKDGYVAYTIRVRGATSEGVWSFQRRYSRLREVYEQLRKSVRTVLPNFPPKKFFGNTQDAFLQVRRAALEQTYRSIAVLPEVRENTLFQAFLRPKDMKVEEAPQAPPSPAQVVDSPQPTRPTVQLTKESETCLNRIVDQVTNQFINLADLPMPLETEDIRRKQKEYGRLLANLRVDWRPRTPRSEQPVATGLLGSKAKKWSEDKARELDTAIACAAVLHTEVIVPA